MDEIPTKILKLGEEELHNRLYELILQIHDAEVIPEDLGEKMKKQTTSKTCLTTHGTKPLCRIEEILEKVLEEDLLGF